MRLLCLLLVFLGPSEGLPIRGRLLADNEVVLSFDDGPNDVTSPNLPCPSPVQRWCDYVSTHEKNEL